MLVDGTPISEALIHSGVDGIVQDGYREEA